MDAATSVALLGTRRVALLLGCTEGLLHYLVRRGEVPRPTLVGGRRVWTEEQVRACASAVAAHRARSVRVAQGPQS